jgi:hypothetical protein
MIDQKIQNSISEMNSPLVAGLYITAPSFLNGRSAEHVSSWPEPAVRGSTQDVGNGGRPDGRRTRPEPPFLTRSGRVTDRGYCFKHGGVL